MPLPKTCAATPQGPVIRPPAGLNTLHRSESEESQSITVAEVLSTRTTSCRIREESEALCCSAWPSPHLHNEIKQSLLKIDMGTLGTMVNINI